MIQEKKTQTYSNAILTYHPSIRAISVSDINGIPLSQLEQSEIVHPVKATIDLLDACNSNCTYCSVPNHKAGNVLPVHSVKRISDALKAMQVFELVFRGGEPTMHPDFYDIVNYTSEMGLYTVIITNGILLDKSKAEELLDSPYVKLVLSLDGPESVNGKYRKNGQHDRVMSWMPDLLQDKSGQIAVITTLYKESSKTLPAFARKMAELGLGLHYLNAVKKEGYGNRLKESDFLTEEELTELSSELKRISSEYCGYLPVQSFRLSPPHDFSLLNLQQFTELYSSTCLRVLSDGSFGISGIVHFNPDLEDVILNKGVDVSLRPLGNINDLTTEQIIKTWEQEIGTRVVQSQLISSIYPHLLNQATLEECIDDFNRAASNS